jgi:hypothetical protein
MVRLGQALLALGPLCVGPFILVWPFPGPYPTCIESGHLFAQAPFPLCLLQTLGS